MARRLPGASGLSVWAPVALSAPIAGQTARDVLGGAIQKAPLVIPKPPKAPKAGWTPPKTAWGLSGERAVEKEQKSAAADK